MAVAVGARAEVQHVVIERDCARSLGSGDVDVLGTPAVVALCERAAVAAVHDDIDPSTTTVGSRVDLEHLAPTPPGRRVTARAVLERVDGKRLHFRIEASDETGVIARGEHVRVVVDRARFAATAITRGT